MSKSKSTPRRQQLRQKRPIPEDEVKGDAEENQSCIKTDEGGKGGGNNFNLAPIFRHLAGFLFGSFITLSYQPLVNDPICKPFLGVDADGDPTLVGVEALSWWKGFLVSTICDHHAKISGFLLRFGVSISGAMLIAFALNFVFAKWKQAQPQYKDEFKLEVGNETWTLGTTLKIKREEVKQVNNDPSPESGSAETLESQDVGGVDPDEALRFLFRAIDHFGKNTEVIKQNPSLESLFQTADICAALSHLDKRVVKNWPDVLDTLVTKLKENRDTDTSPASAPEVQQA